MRSVYVERLRRVGREQEAVQQEVGYVIDHWQAQSIYDEMPGLTPRDLRDANALLERTYFIRLFAEFEGILKDHLDTNHPTLRWRGSLRAAVRDKLDVNENISLVIRADSLTLAEGERHKLLEIRGYRNSIAHLNSTVPTVITFGDAVSTLNRFLAKLPGPIR